jgi:predicted  nucleic acid-binding Zn-ribbon protein
MSGFMENMTQPFWVGFMQRAHDNIEPIARERPAGIQVLPAFVIRSSVNSGSTIPSPATDLFPSWYKKPGSTNNEKVIRDRVSGKRATECTPPLALEEVVQGDAGSFSSDPFYDAATNSSDEDDVHKCDDIKPTISLAVNSLSAGQYSIVVTVGAGTHPISSDKFAGQLNVSVAGQAIPDGSIQIAGPGVYTINYTSIHDSAKTVQAEVTDSVLYTSLDARDVSFKLTPAPVVPPVVITPPAGP